MTYSKVTASVLSATVAASIFASAGMAAEKMEYISGAVVRTSLADGKPWSMTSADGKKAMFTFNSDGTGKLSGPITMSIKWKLKGENFCIAMGMMLGTKCFRFVAVKGGYQGYAKDKPGMAFRR